MCIYRYSEGVYVSIDTVRMCVYIYRERERERERESLPACLQVILSCLCAVAVSALRLGFVCGITKRLFNTSVPSPRGGITSDYFFALFSTCKLMTWCSMQDDQVECRGTASMG